MMMQVENCYSPTVHEKEHHFLAGPTSRNNIAVSTKDSFEEYQALLFLFLKDVAGSYEELGRRGSGMSSVTYK